MRMPKNGLVPIKRDKRDYSFHRTFGGVGIFPDNFNTDAGLTMPDQDAPNPQYNPPIPMYPSGCTDYTQNELCIDEDKVLYRPDFTESKVHANQNGGADIRVSLSSVCNDGVQKEGEDASLASSHKREAYFNVGRTTDWFDGMRSAIMTANRSISIGTPWFREWATPQQGVVPDVFVWNGNAADYPWHNWKICGWKTINGQPYLIGKTWQGKNYGDNGLAYFSRQCINGVMEIPGTGAFTVAATQGASVQTIQIGLLEQLIVILKQILGIYQRAAGTIKRYGNIFLVR